MRNEKRILRLSVPILAAVLLAVVLLVACRREAVVVAPLAATHLSELNVTGAVDLDSTLNVDGASTLNSTLDVDGATTLNSTADVDGATTLNSTLDVDGNISSGTGFITATDSVIIDGQADAVALTVQAYTTPTGQIFVVENSGGTDKLTVDASGNVTASGTLNVVGAVDLDSTLNVDGNISDAGTAVTFADDVMIDGAADTRQLIIQGNATQTGPLLTAETSTGADVATIDVSGNISAAAEVDVGTFLQLSEASAQTIVDGTAGITPTATYHPITAAGAVGNTMYTTGFTAGDLVILVNEGANAITITDTGTTMLTGNIALGQYDSLTLLFDGTNWVEVSASNN